MYSGYIHKTLRNTENIVDMGFKFNNYPTSIDKKKFNKTVQLLRLLSILTLLRRFAFKQVTF